MGVLLMMIIVGQTSLSGILVIVGHRVAILVVRTKDVVEHDFPNRFVSSVKILSVCFGKLQKDFKFNVKAVLTQPPK